MYSCKGNPKDQQPSSRISSALHFHLDPAASVTSTGTCLNTFAHARLQLNHKTHSLTIKTQLLLSLAMRCLIRQHRVYNAETRLRHEINAYVCVQHLLSAPSRPHHPCPVRCVTWCLPSAPAIHPSCGSHDGPSEPTKQLMWPRQQTRPPASSSVFCPVVGQDESNERRFSGTRRLPAEAVRSLLLLHHTTHFCSGIVACGSSLDRRASMHTACRRTVREV
ncbi:hypothetical protein IWZ03DRAFT_138455 [Phyllosticta citriasiana]|uniref:Uncharacterized protein n=1 Tax=Phyllosticta citriasiana TaxID=595635 RepID=A0ABR1KSE1_9PEZI